MLCLSFNQSFSCLIVGRSTGFRIFNCSPFSKCFDSSLMASGSSDPVAPSCGVFLCEMLFNTSLVGLVGSGDASGDSPRTLRLFNTRTEKSICEVNFVSSVLAIRLSLTRLVSVHERKIHLFELKTMKVLHSLDTVRNERGICALSSAGNSHLIFPASETTGELLVYDATNLQLLNSIKAHNTRCRCLAFNRHGNLLATVSELGTVVRVFSIPDGAKLFTFRRGTRSAQVNSLAFNCNSSLLALSSENSSTVHVFSLIQRQTTEPQNSKAAKTAEPAGISSLLTGESFSLSQLGSALYSSGQQLASTAASAMASVSQQLSHSQYAKSLPPSLIDLVEPERHFASVSLRDSTHPRAVAFDSNVPNRLLIVSNEGYLYNYSVPSSGGQCRVEAEFSLLEKPSEAIGAKIHKQNAQQQKTQPTPGIHPQLQSQIQWSQQMRSPTKEKISPLTYSPSTSPPLGSASQSPALQPQPAAPVKPLALSETFAAAAQQENRVSEQSPVPDFSTPSPSPPRFQAVGRSEIPPPASPLSAENSHHSPVAADFPPPAVFSPSPVSDSLDEEANRALLENFSSLSTEAEPFTTKILDAEEFNKNNLWNEEEEIPSFPTEESPEIEEKSFPLSEIGDFQSSPGFHWENQNSPKQQENQENKKEQKNFPPQQSPLSSASASRTLSNSNELLPSDPDRSPDPEEEEDRSERSEHSAEPETSELSQPSEAPADGKAKGKKKKKKAKGK